MKDKWWSGCKTQDFKMGTRAPRDHGYGFKNTEGEQILVTRRKNLHTKYTKMIRSQQNLSISMGLKKEDQDKTKKTTYRKWGSHPFPVEMKLILLHLLILFIMNHLVRDRNSLKLSKSQSFWVFGHDFSKVCTRYFFAVIKNTQKILIKNRQI